MDIVAHFLDQMHDGNQDELNIVNVDDTLHGGDPIIAETVLNGTIDLDNRNNSVHSETSNASVTGRDPQRERTVINVAPTESPNDPEARRSFSRAPEAAMANTATHVSALQRHSLP